MSSLYRPGALALFTLVAAASCADETAEPAELGAVCGQQGPVRLLELSPDEPLASVSQVAWVGDRRILRVAYLEPDAEPQFFLPPVKRVELWSVGACGESPQVVAEDAELALFPDAWPEEAFACDAESGAVEIVDLEGDRPANRVFELPGCDALVSERGVVSYTPADPAADHGALALQRFPADPWTETATVEPLLGSVGEWGAGGIVPIGARVTSEELFAITTNDELVRVSLVDGAQELVASAAVAFSASADGRWLLWQDAGVTNGDSDQPEGAVYLLDTADGSETYLDDGRVSAGSLSYIEHGAVVLRRTSETPGERVLMLPDATPVDLPESEQVTRRLEDGRWATWNPITGVHKLYDPTFASVRVLHEGVGEFLIYEHGIEVRENGFPASDESYLRTEAPVIRVPWDGEATPVAHRATPGYRRLADGRVATLVDVGTDWLGQLVVVDPETLEEQQVDDRVIVAALRNYDADDELVYGVYDGERTGVWLASFAD